MTEDARDRLAHRLDYLLAPPDSCMTEDARDRLAHRLDYLLAPPDSCMTEDARDRLYRLGCALHGQRRWAAAAACFSRALGSVDPEIEGRTLTNYGWNLHLIGRGDEAEAVLNAASIMIPTEGGPYALKAQALLDLCHDGIAVGVARRGVELSPDMPIAHMALAFANGMTGRWDECWREYEWRFRYRPDLFAPRAVPLWRGEPVTHLWIECEMGLGDTIFGMRWLPEAMRRAERIELHVQPPLRSWVAATLDEAMPGAHVGVRAVPCQPPSDAEAWCPLLSLPVALGDPSGRPYPQPRGIYRYNDAMRVGICWSGNPAHEQSHLRDCPLPYWIQFAENPRIELHSLQIGGSQQLADLGLLDLIRDRAPEITNFADTADILNELDLLITVDTAVAHLAGSMGVPTWLLVNQRGQDFRWQRRDATPWYPAMRLFRRSRDEDWSAVMLRIDRELRA